MHWQLLIFILLSINSAQSDLLKWETNVRDASFECPAPNEIESSIKVSQIPVPFVSVIDCSVSDAIYHYDFKVSL